ncbi:MAG: hypothetical protein MUO24_01445, partial [Desulfobacterales bacterium]|nr:hypothetical protein [Desulfobacterales bacterium]
MKIKMHFDAKFRYYEILKTISVVRILCNGGIPAPIPGEQINGLQTLMKNSIAITPCQYLKEG